MTTIASPSVQTAVGQIVARILDRTRVPADGAIDTPPAAAPTNGARPNGAAPGRPGRTTPDAVGTGAQGQGKPAATDAGPAAPASGNPNNGAGTATPVDSTSVILSALLSLANRALPMDINLNQLLNTATLKSPLTQLPAELLAKPQVIEAVVLRSTLLPGAPSAQPQPANPLLAALAGASALPPRYQINMQWQGRVLQFVSPQPLPPGSTAQLQINNRGEVLLLPAALPAAPPARGTAQTLPGTPIATRGQSAEPMLLTTLARSTPQSAALATATVTVAPQQPAAAFAKLTAPQQTLQQSLREVLPRQEALHTLVPLLRKLLTPANNGTGLPAPIAKQLVRLLQSLPRPEQLQTGAGVKRALENSGSFLEARIARSTAPASAAAPNTEPLGRVLTTDLKAQMTALLDTVRRLLPDTAAAPQASEGDAEAALADELVYNPKQLQRGNPAATQRDDTINAGDLQLAQLSKLLQSGLARIQLNQLDGAVSRHSSADPQVQVPPAWVLELPLANTRGHSDNLQLRIEQHHHQQQTRTRVQWNVQIAFDLHELGKIAATLAIIDKSVAATVWAEQANTHRSVRDKIDYLRAGLESVGVRVTEVQCRHGLPPERAALISQQLVDVHT